MKLSIPKMSNNIHFLPKLILTDIDGVWTDGGMYYDQNNNELKKFHTYDSAGILFCRMNGIKTGIITGEETEIVERRAKKLKVDFLVQGSSNKLKMVNEICRENSFSLNDIAYLGDDLNDVEILRNAGFSACPSSAPWYIKEIVDKVMVTPGGNGVFREFVEYILERNNKLNETLRQLGFPK